MTPLTRNAALTIGAVPATNTKRWCDARAWRSASIKVWMTEESMNSAAVTSTKTNG